MRHFGNPMGGTARLGGMSADSPSRGDTLPLLPANSINSGRAPLESGDVADTLRDQISLSFFLLFLCGIAVVGGALGAVIAAFLG